MTSHPGQQRSSPPPNFPVNLHIIKEDASDAANEQSHKEVFTDRDLEEDGSGEPKKKVGLQRPQISITDAQGHVVAVPTIEEADMLTEEVPLASGGLSVSSMPGLVSASKAASEMAALGSYGFTGSSNAITDTGSSASSSMPNTSQGSYGSYGNPALLRQYYNKYPLFFHYPGLNLANIPPDESMEMETDNGGTPLAYGRMQGVYPSPVGVYGHQAIPTTSSGQYSFSDRPSYFQHTSPQYRYNSKDDPLTSYGVERGPVAVTTRGGSQTLGSAGSTPEKDLHQETFSPHDLSKLVSVGEVPEPGTSAMLEALNLHNGLADVHSNVCFALSLSLTSKRTMSEILKEIKSTLDNQNPSVVYEHSENRFRLENSGGVQIEMEVCPGVVERGVRFRKVAGDTWQFNRLCDEIISGMNL